MSLFTINSVTLVGGNLTRDAELKFLPNGTAQAKFDIAMNRSYPDGQGGYKEETSYFRIILWGKPAEKLVNQLKKGKKVAIEGRLSQRRWQGDDGKTNSIVEVIANTVIPYEIPRRERGDDDQSQPAGGGYRQGAPGAAAGGASAYPAAGVPDFQGGPDGGFPDYDRGEAYQERRGGDFKSDLKDEEVPF